MQVVETAPDAPTPVGDISSDPLGFVYGHALYNFMDDTIEEEQKDNTSPYLTDVLVAINGLHKKLDTIH